MNVKKAEKVSTVHTMHFNQVGGGRKEGAPCFAIPGFGGGHIDFEISKNYHKLYSAFRVAGFWVLVREVHLAIQIFVLEETDLILKIIIIMAIEIVFSGTKRKRGESG
jgi:hypothetical protein